MTSHALLSASGAQKWMACPGSVAMEKDIPNTSSEFSELGTVAHEVASRCLIGNAHPNQYLGYTFIVVDGKILDEGKPILEAHRIYTVDQDMVEHVASYIQVVHDFTPINAQRFIEERVDFSKAIGVENSFGTSDVIIISNNEIAIVDLKFGMGVRVDADNNPQLMLYALGAYNKYRFIHDIKRVRMVIHQPRLNHLSEWDCSVEELLAFADKAANAAATAITLLKINAGSSKPLFGESDFGPDLNPGEKTCRWCRAKGQCPALANQVMSMIADDFVDLTKEDVAVTKVQNAIETLDNVEEHRLSALLSLAPLMEIFLKGIRERAFAKLSAGDKLKGFKLVRGRAGHRKWSDEEVVEEILKRTPLKEYELYKTNLISPTEAEKKLKSVSKIYWEMLVPLTVRSEGSLSVAPESDKREAVVGIDISNDFENLETGEE